MGATLHGASAKTLSKSGSAAETAAGTAYKNHTKDGSTAKGIASDAKRGAKKRGKQAGKKTASAVKSPLQGMSQRMQNARDNMARRSQEFTEKWGHEDATQWPNASSVDEDDIPDTPPAAIDELAESAEMPDPDSPVWTEEDTTGWGSDVNGADGGGGDSGLDPGFVSVAPYSESQNTSQNTTLDRNSADREVGSFPGGD